MIELAAILRPLLFALIVSAERGTPIYAAAVQLLGALEDAAATPRTFPPRAERRAERR